MHVYFIVFFCVAVLLCYYENRRFSRNIRNKIYNLIVLILVFVAGFRYCVGTDYAQYARNFELYQLSDFSLFSQSALGAVVWISKIIFDDYATWFFIMSIITILPVMRTILRESVCVWLSVMMYILLCCWHTSFNIVKQSAAASLLFAGYPFLRDRKFVKWFAVCLLASTFHVSALLMIPVCFLVAEQITVKRTALIVFAGIAVRLSYDILFELIAFLKQGVSVVREGSVLLTSSVNSLRILVHCVPVLLFLVFHKRYRTQNPDFSCLYYLSLLNAVLNVASMNSIYLNRVCIYTIIFNVLFIPMLFQPIKRKRSTVLILPSALVFYFAFWAYDLYKCADTVVFRWIWER